MDVMATIRFLDTDEALTEGLAELGRLDPVMARLIAEGAWPALRRREQRCGPSPRRSPAAAFRSMNLAKCRRTRPMPR